MIGKIFKLVIFLIVVGLVGLVGFAYVGDLSPEQTDTDQPVLLKIE